MVLHFKSKTAYNKWNAYREMHNIPTVHKQEVIIAGHKHKVKHGR